MVFQSGTVRGVQVLDALELGSSDTLDLHLDLLRPGTSITDDYKVYEYGICGTQADARWFEAPIRYAKEDGSDGVVRVASANLTPTYVRFGPTEEAAAIDWRSAEQLRRDDLRRRDEPGFYERKDLSRPGHDGRPEIPFAIPYACAHSGDDLGVVSGTQPFEQVFGLIRTALETRPQQWRQRVATFDEAAFLDQCERALWEREPMFFHELDHTGERLSGWLPGIHLSEQGRAQADEVAGRHERDPLDGILEQPVPAEELLVEGREPGRVRDVQGPPADRQRHAASPPVRLRSGTRHARRTRHSRPAAGSGQHPGVAASLFIRRVTRNVVPVSSAVSTVMRPVAVEDAGDKADDHALAELASVQAGCG
jgi:hypothetical protein